MEERLPVIKKQKPRSRSSKRLLLFLFLFFVTLLLVLFFQSSLSQITEVTIKGQHLVAEEQIRDAAAILPGDHFFSVSSERAAQRVKALRMIEDVEVKKQFPGRISITVHEFPKVAYQFTGAGDVEALLADGSSVPVTMEGARLDKPILSGWSGREELKLQLCSQMAKLPDKLFIDISEIVPVPTTAYPDKIKLYTRSSFEVVTSVGYIAQKLPYLDAYIASLKMNHINEGILTLLEADSHAPFPPESSVQVETNGGSEKPRAAEQTTPSPERALRE
ncbi:cell division protein FtsQ/DivIB [Paenibacillus sp. YYML68]|uniref:cell division protein FtsQ/DivIB n=1 Tax=Paenibacillus sp. YYML68 TaxID=2909250 RepID=UPI0024913B56|nr:FtsQ-type POTRA domain-containing protein [Paenibacillus sp. YYML68]